jgi:hypothetical protein
MLRALFFPKHKFLEYWNTPKTSVTTDCDSLEHAQKIISHSRISQEIVEIEIPTK